MYAFKISFKEVKKKKFSSLGGRAGGRSALLIHVALQKTRDQLGNNICMAKPGREKEAVNWGRPANKCLQQSQRRAQGRSGRGHRGARTLTKQCRLL
jgi:hypothetical protein